MLVILPLYNVGQRNTSRTSIIVEHSENLTILLMKAERLKKRK